MVRSARISRPLLDVRLYRNTAYAASSLMNFAVGATVFGAMILMPLYYQSVRNLDPVQTGLLVAPTGIGVALTTRLASSLTDRIGSGRTALAGGLIAAVGTVPFVLLGADTSYVWLSFAGPDPRRWHRAGHDPGDGRGLPRDTPGQDQRRHHAGQRAEPARRLDRHRRLHRGSRSTPWPAEAR